MGRTSDADEKLMIAATDLMWDEGYGAVTIDEICERAGVKKGSFYYYFKSKADLAVAALEKLWRDEWKPKMDRVFSPSLDPIERITGYLEGIYQMQVDHFKQHGTVLGCPFWSVGSEVSTQEIDVNAKVREVISRKWRYYESAIRAAMAQGSFEKGDPDEKAQTMGFLLEGAISQARIMNNPEALRNLSSSVLEILRAKTTPPVGAPR